MIFFTLLAESYTIIIYLCFIFQKESFSSSLIHPKLSSRLEKYAKLHKYTAPILIYKKFLKPPVLHYYYGQFLKKNLGFFLLFGFHFFLNKCRKGLLDWLILTDHWISLVDDLDLVKRCFEKFREIMISRGKSYIFLFKPAGPLSLLYGRIR